MKFPISKNIASCQVVPAAMLTTLTSFAAKIYASFSFEMPFKMPLQKTWCQGPNPKPFPYFIITPSGQPGKAHIKTFS